MADDRAQAGGWGVFVLSICSACVILFAGYGWKQGMFENMFGQSKAPREQLDVGLLLPHRAVYDVKMKSIKDASVLTNLSGKLVYEWNADCFGARTDHKFSLRYDYKDYPSVEVDKHMSYFEPFSGGLHFFETVKHKNEALSKMDTDIRGYVDADGQLAYFTAPEAKEVKLPEGVMFPTAHTLGLVYASLSGENVYYAEIFDGAEQRASMQVNAVIGDYAVPYSDNPNLQLEAFSALARYVSMAFYGDDVGEELTKDGENTPLYEVKGIFYQNGVMRNVDIDYDDFVVSQELEAIEVLRPACRD